MSGIASVLAIFFLSSCINPFSGGNNKDSDGDGEAGGQAGSLEIGLIDGIDGSTIAPDGTALSSAIASYTLVVEDSGANFDTITQENLTAASFPYTFADLPSTTWLVTLSGYNGSGQLIAQSPETPVTVSASGTSVNLTLSAIQSGAPGSFTYNLSWPAARVDGVIVSLFSVSDPANPISSGTAVDTFSSGSDYSINIPGGSLSVNSQQPSGSYLLQVDLSYNGVSYPSIYEAVQVYDYLPSSKSVTLTNADLTEPPSAPTDLVVSVIDQTTVDLYWTDSSSMEAGYRVFAFDGLDPGNIQQIGGDLPPNTQQLTGAVSPFGTFIDEFNVRVVAFNDFGESTPLQVEFRLLPNNQLPRLNPFTTPRTNDASWVALNDPGILEASTPIVGGADSMDLFLSTADNLNDVFALPAPTVTQGTLSYDLSGYAALAAGQTFYWRTQANTGTTRIVYPVRAFTVRDGNLYVDASTGLDTAAGSIGAPLATLVQAVTMAEPGETIHATSGTYDQGLITIGQDLAIEGSYQDTTYTTKTSAATSIVVNGGGGSQTLSLSGGTVVLDGLEIRAPQAASSAQVINFSGGNVVIRNAALQVPDTVTTDIQTRIGTIAGTTGDSLTIENSPITLGGTITGAAQGYGFYVFGTSGADLTFSNTVFDTSTLAADQLYWFYVQGGAETKTITIEDSIFSGTVAGTGSSAHFYSTNTLSGTTLIFRNNVVSGIDNGAGQSVAVQLVRGVQSTRIENNRFDMSQSAAGNLEAISVYTEDMLNGERPLVTANKIRVRSRTGSGSSYGIRVSGDNIAMGPIIANNIIEAFETGDLYTYPISTNVQGTEILHNTVVHETGFTGLGRQVTLNVGDTDSVIANNIFLNNAANAYDGLVNNAGASVAIHTNAFEGTSEATAAGTLALNIGTNRSGNFAMNLDVTTGSTIDQNDWYALGLSAPPILESGGTDAYVVTVGSDILGNLRGSDVTIGAYETAGPSLLATPGPSGGLLYYVNPNHIAAGWRFLEAAPSDYQAAPWADPGLVVTNTDAAIGTGQDNTSQIVSVLGAAGQTGTAAQIADAWVVTNGNGENYEDWFLPSADELEQMYIALNSTGTFPEFVYWSSTEASDTDARGYNFNVGLPSTATKSINYASRASRRF